MESGNPISFSFWLYFAEMLCATPRFRNGSFFFVLKTKSGEKCSDLLCEKMEKRIALQLCENVTVLSEVGP